MTADERLEAARQATREGRYQEALDGLVWFHHHALEEDRALAAVRLSYALFYWLDLAKVYPPAMQALEDLREQKAQALLRGDGDRELFHDVTSIDQRLGHNRATYELYLALAERMPELAASGARLALPAIAAVGDYALADQVRGEPLTRIRNAAEGLRTRIRWTKHNRRSYGKAPARWAIIKGYVRDVRLQVEISAGVGRHDEARKLAALALALIADPPLRAEVRTALARRSSSGLKMARWDHRRAKALRREGRRRAA